MNRTMILPAVIAAGLHVALLGFRTSPPPRFATLDESKSIADGWRFSIDPEDMQPPQELIVHSDPPFSQLGCPFVPQRFKLRSINSYLPFQMIRPFRVNVDVSGFDRIDLNLQPNRDGAGWEDMPWVLLTPLDNVPRALFRHGPTRPSGTGTDRETVTVDFVVGKDGIVAQVRVVDSTASALEEICLRAVKRWRFEPGLRKNRAVAFRMQQTFVFTQHD